jgi:hypothetical protein
VIFSYVAKTFGNKIHTSSGCDLVISLRYLIPYPEY